MSTRNNNNTGDVARDLLFARQSLVKYLRIKGERPVRLHIISQKVYPYSVICVVEAIAADKFAGRYYIKRMLIRAGGRYRAEKQCIDEARLLRQLNQCMPYETVELVRVIPARLVMITAECAGTSFSRVLRWYSILCYRKAYQQKLVNYSARCGDWLRRFHSVSKTKGDGLHDWVKFLCGEVEWRVKALSTHDTENYAIYAAVAVKLEDDLKSLPVSACASIIHRDFAPHNIFVDTNHIQVLDFSDVQEGHGLMDVINYIASLASRCESRFISTSLIQEMCVAFVQAYGEVSTDDMDLYRSLLVLQSLKRLLVLRQCRGKLPLDSIMRCGEKWHRSYLNAYINDEYSTDKLSKGPWPFMDLMSP